MTKFVNILVIGGGGREHAICKSLKKSKLLGKLYCWGKICNPGIYKLVNGIFYEPRISYLIDLFDKYKINFVIVGPEQVEDNSISDLYFRQN